MTSAPLVVGGIIPPADEKLLLESGVAAVYTPKNYDLNVIMFNRWLVPPAALAIHLCIGMAYGFSVFWLPLSRIVGGAAPKDCPADMGVLAQIFTTSCDWKISMLGWTFTLFFVLLGSSAAVFGHWLETAGPRKAALAAAFCWCGGLLISALGVSLHQIWMIWIGSGVIGGVGLGLGYISPVSTLIKWFPDRRGLATGLAIMGFGGGAMIGAPLADKLMGFFATPDSPGVWQTFIALAAIYFVFMVCGASAIACRPRAGRLRAGRRPPRRQRARHASPRPSRRRVEDPAILAALGRALPQRLGRHRRARHGLAHAAGSLRRQAHRPRHRL